ncbi:MAG: hypothetical protein R3F29_08750 [Planctomycetota bacterium]
MPIPSPDGMGHIVIASPPIARFRLLVRLRRELVRRGHRVTLLATESAQATFWRHQVGELTTVDEARTEDPALAAAVAAIASRHRLGPRRSRQLARRAAGLCRWLADANPDLVLFHAERTPTNACLQHLAAQAGIAVLWTGDGLLPGTMQVDDLGLDGDASCRRWTARDFRVVTPDRALLDASLAHGLAAPAPFELPAPPVTVPPLRERLRDAARLALTGDWRGAGHALHAWREALPTAPVDAAFAGHDPRGAGNGPSVVVLLQRADDPALRLDCEDAPGHAELLRHAAAAAAALDPRARLAVLADDDLQQGLRARCAALPRALLVPMAAAPTWLATTAAVITVNHRLAGLALACGTPVVHLGHGLFDTAGVTTPSTLATLPADLVRAARRDRRALRRRVLSWLLRHGHVWCAADAPNHNGMLGLLQVVEQRLAGPVAPRPLPYRAGPTWPLAST